MIKGIKDFFTEKIKHHGSEEEYQNPAALPHEAKRAACAVLIELACIDGEFSHVELKELALSLQKEFDLSRDELYELIDLADQELKESQDIGQFAELINEYFSDYQKKQLMVLVWQVIYADGKLEKKEERFAKQIMNRLRLSEEVMAWAKQEAAKAM